MGFVNASLCDDEQPVQSGLCVTPRRMDELRQKGIPISSQMSEALYNDGQIRVDFQPSLMDMRHVDPADMWEKRQDVKQTFKNEEKQIFNVEEEN